MRLYQIFTILFQNMNNLTTMTYAAKNAAISTNFMMWKFCGKTQFRPGESLPELPSHKWSVDSQKFTKQTKKSLYVVNPNQQYEKLFSCRITYQEIRKAKYFQKQLPEVFLEISQNSPEHIFSRTPFLQTSYGRVLLYLYIKIIELLNAWCPLKRDTYLNKPATFSCRFF